MIITEEVEVKWKRATMGYYKSKGYIYTGLEQPFMVKVIDLKEGSHETVEVLCDYCLENGIHTVIPKEYRIYIKQNKKSKIHKDCCDQCWSLKLQESMQLTYGQSNASNVIEFQDKRTNTFIDRYGTNSPMKVPEFVEKGKQTNLRKYGVTHLMKIPEVAQERLIKLKQTIYKNGSGAVSKQQLYLHELLGGKLNYPVNILLLDIAFPEDKIYIEYNGSGHNLQVRLNNITQKEFENKERKRFYALRKDGWKLIKIVSSKDKLPSDMSLKYFIALAFHYLKSSNTYFEINIDDKTLKYNKNVVNMDFHNLRVIKPKQLQLT